MGMLLKRFIQTMCVFRMCFKIKYIMWKNCFTSTPPNTFPGGIQGGSPPENKKVVHLKVPMSFTKYWVLWVMLVNNMIFLGGEF
jgi:hypothetical protein